MTNTRFEEIDKVKKKLDALIMQRDKILIERTCRDRKFKKRDESEYAIDCNWARMMRDCFAKFRTKQSGNAEIQMFYELSRNPIEIDVDEEFVEMVLDWYNRKISKLQQEFDAM